jgi:hypothetical protein
MRSKFVLQIKKRPLTIHGSGVSKRGVPSFRALNWPLPCDHQIRLNPHASSMDFYLESYIGKIPKVPLKPLKVISDVVIPDVIRLCVSMSELLSAINCCCELSRDPGAIVSVHFL